MADANQTHDTERSAPLAFATEHRDLEGMSRAASRGSKAARS